jgi:hypothetical protein
MPLPITPKIRVFYYLCSLLCAGSVFAQIPGSVAPNGSGAAVSGNSGGTTSVTPTGYATSLVNSSVSAGSASITSSVEASIRSSSTSAISGSLKDTPENNIPVSSNAGDRRSPFSSTQFTIAGVSQFRAQSGFRAGAATGVKTGETQKIASRLPEAQAWSGAGSKIGSRTDSSQLAGSSLSTKLQSSGLSPQQILSATGKNQASSPGPKLGGRGGAAASYIPNGFPDSAKGTAMLSPPEVNYGQLFSKSSASTLSFALPDMSNHEFLSPSLRGSVRRAGGGGRSPERQMRDRLRDGSGSARSEHGTSSSLHKMASENDSDKLRSQLKSPLDRPLIKPLESESLHSHSIH